ncbi:hypothetical protein A2U01_0053836, partial [Trifolium medium]|nr:hypothetical protein [Trifolium medium]
GKVMHRNVNQPAGNTALALLMHMMVKDVQFGLETL